MRGAAVLMAGVLWCAALAATAGAQGPGSQGPQPGSATRVGLEDCGPPTDGPDCTTLMLIGDDLTTAPEASINDATVIEDDSLEGEESVRAEFIVTLSAPSPETVTVDYATEQGSASTFWDYEIATGRLTFEPNDTEELVSVLIGGDRLDEVDETFSVRLSNPANATIADGLGTGTILDNDPEPSLQVSGSSDVPRPGSIYEGHDASFMVVLSASSGRTGTVDYATENGTATAGQDYQASSGTLTFAHGEIVKMVTVPTLQDTAAESEERFGLRLSSASNATIGDALGEMVVSDDGDEPPPPSDRARPRITIRGVKASRCVERAFKLRVRIQDGSSLHALRIKLNGKKLHSSDRKHFSRRIRPRELKRGRNKLTVVATDKGGRAARRTVRFKKCP